MLANRVLKDLEEDHSRRVIQEGLPLKQHAQELGRPGLGSMQGGADPGQLPTYSHPPRPGKTAAAERQASGGSRNRVRR